MIARRREQRQAERRQDFVGGYLMRAIAEERVRQAAKIAAPDSPERETPPSEDDGFTEDVDPLADDYDGARPPAKKRSPQQPAKKGLRSIVAFGLPMPVLAKLGLLLALSTIFLRMGAVTFGGGYVMIPLIESEVVEHRAWLTHQEFADATALGQITPGPVLITATFIGYRVAGTLGALVATISIFLPSFLMTIAAGASLRRFRTNEIVQSFLRGVTPAVVGLLVAAAISIGRAGIHSWVGMSLAVLAGFVLIRFRLNAFWVILGAGLVRFSLGMIPGLN